MKRKNAKMIAAQDLLDEWCLWWAGQEPLDEKYWIAFLPTRALAVEIAARWNRGPAKASHAKAV